MIEQLNKIEKEQLKISLELNSRFGKLSKSENLKLERVNGLLQGIALAKKHILEEIEKISDIDNAESPCCAESINGVVNLFGDDKRCGLHELKNIIKGSE